ncbi:TetR/AcrR family transcriptional regulator [Paenibacillus puerhi]|uniref:TetR/AcrR family transcriptional regulator n=1 Tax=Paenibacillus puerhi TaxID=2692622 RepID=UPI00135B10B1|nr:TetR/AcrR family transcriptional regulator [Paenibacillus puerhi]
MAPDKREIIIASALKLFEELGYHNTKISHIVKEAGIAQGTFYLYFKSKEDVFRIVIEQCLEEILVALSPEPLAASGLSEREQHYQVIRASLVIYYHNKPILRILKRNGAASPEIEDIATQFYSKICSVLMDLIRPFIPHYSEEELEAHVYATIGMVEMAAYQWFISKGHGLEKLDMLTQVLMEINMECGGPDGGDAP